MRSAIFAICFIMYFDGLAIAKEENPAERAYAAFECAFFARVASAHDPAKVVTESEYKRLFALGIELARAHAATIRSGEYDPDTDILDGFQWSLSGPSNDFIAGRFAEYSESAAKQLLPKRAVTLAWTGESGEVARKKYYERNCHLIQ